MPLTEILALVHDWLIHTLSRAVSTLQWSNLLRFEIPPAYMYCGRGLSQHNLEKHFVKDAIKYKQSLTYAVRLSFNRDDCQV